jgi:hypothetical protein
MAQAVGLTVIAIAIICLRYSTAGATPCLGSLI